MVIFEGHVSGEGANAQHALPINVTYDFISIKLQRSSSSSSPDCLTKGSTGPGAESAIYDCLAVSCVLDSSVHQ